MEGAERAGDFIARHDAAMAGATTTSTLPKAAVSFSANARQSFSVRPGCSKTRNFWMKTASAARGQDEMAFQQGNGRAEFRQDFVSRHAPGPSFGKIMQVSVPWA